MNHWSDSDGVSAKSTAPNKHFNQIETEMSHVRLYRLISLDRMTYCFEHVNTITKFFVSANQKVRSYFPLILDIF